MLCWYCKQILFNLFVKIPVAPVFTDVTRPFFPHMLNVDNSSFYSYPPPLT